MVQNVQVLTKYNERGLHNRRQPGSLHKNNRTYVRAYFLGILLVALLTVSGLASALFGNQDAYAANDHTSAQATVTVDQGDTLWSIASEHSAKGQDVREYVFQLKKVNGLKNSTLQVGQKLVLPTAR